MGVPRLLQWLRTAFPTCFTDTLRSCDPPRTLNSDRPDALPNTPSTWASPDEFSSTVEDLYVDLNGLFHEAARHVVEQLYHHHRHSQQRQEDRSGTSHLDCTTCAATLPSLLDEPTVLSCGLVASSSLVEQAIIAHVVAALEHVAVHPSSPFRPSSCLVLAMDGVAPLAKLTCQRQRRFHANTSSAFQFAQSVFGFDVNALSCGTEFLEKLTVAVREFAMRVTTTTTTTPSTTASHVRSSLGSSKMIEVVVLDDATRAGEGEWKLLSFLRNQQPKRQNPSQPSPSGATPAFDHTTCRVLLSSDSDVMLGAMAVLGTTSCSSSSSTCTVPRDDRRLVVVKPLDEALFWFPRRNINNNLNTTNQRQHLSHSSYDQPLSSDRVTAKKKKHPLQQQTGDSHESLTWIAFDVTACREKWASIQNEALQKLPEPQNSSHPSFPVSHLNRSFLDFVFLIGFALGTDYFPGAAKHWSQWSQHPTRALDALVQHYIRFRRLEAERLPVASGSSGIQHKQQHSDRSSACLIVVAQVHSEHPPPPGEQLPPPLSHRLCHRTFQSFLQFLQREEEEEPKKIEAQGRDVLAVDGQRQRRTTNLTREDSCMAVVGGGGWFAKVSSRGFSIHLNGGSAAGGGEGGGRVGAESSGCHPIAGSNEQNSLASPSSTAKHNERDSTYDPWNDTRSNCSPSSAPLPSSGRSANHKSSEEENSLSRKKAGSYLAMLDWWSQLVFDGICTNWAAHYDASDLPTVAELLEVLSLSSSSSALPSSLPSSLSSTAGKGPFRFLLPSFSSLSVATRDRLAQRPLPVFAALVALTPLTSSRALVPAPLQHLSSILSTSIDWSQWNWQEILGVVDSALHPFDALKTSPASFASSSSSWHASEARRAESFERNALRVTPAFVFERPKEPSFSSVTEEQKRKAEEEKNDAVENGMTSSSQSSKTTSSSVVDASSPGNLLPSVTSVQAPQWSRRPKRFRDD